jgi:hypothetical protein
MANDRVRPLGFNDLTELLGSEMTTLDLNVSRAPNEVTGSNGVVAAPATAILWGGAGLTVSGQFTASSTTTLSGAVTLSGSAVASVPVSLTMAQPASSTDVGANKLYSTNTPKAWGRFSTNGLGAVTVLDGHNIASVAVNATDITVTFAHTFATPHYAAVPTAETIGVLANPHTQTLTTMKIRQYDVIGAAVVDPSATSTIVSLVVLGQQ